MFELGRELKRFFAADRGKAPADGLTGGDSSLLELLDSQLLAQEAKAADVAAGRISAKDKPRRRLEAAIVWREVARRTGDAVALVLLEWAWAQIGAARPHRAEQSTAARTCAPMTPATSGGRCC